MLGLDLGNFSYVVGATGRRDGTLVLPNRISNRETPALVGFDGHDGRRVVGEAAATQQQSNAQVRPVSTINAAHSRWIQRSIEM
eukprot:SAG11_NODE_7718_length_1105_cov_1.210736_1_plen_84_part_00